MLAYCRALGIQVCEYYLLWGLKYITITEFGLWASRAVSRNYRAAEGLLTSGSIYLQELSWPNVSGPNYSTYKDCWHVVPSNSCTWTRTAPGGSN